jgi:hypothetical protein
MQQLLHNFNGLAVFEGNSIDDLIKVVDRNHNVCIQRVCSSFSRIFFLSTKFRGYLGPLGPLANRFVVSDIHGSKRGDR